MLGQLAVAGDHVRDAGGAAASRVGAVRAGREPELAATIAHRNAFLALIHLRDGRSRRGRAARWSWRRAIRSPSSGTRRSRSSLWRQGRRAEAHAVLAEALSGDEERDAQLNGMECWLRIVGDDDRATRATELAAAAAAELRLGALEIGVVHLNVLARAHFEIGAWDEAAAVAERALAPASQLEDVSARVFVWWAATLVPAARGDWAAADEFARRAAAEPTDAPDRVVAVGIAHALVAAARGDAEAVLARARAGARDRAGAAVDEPGFWPWQHLYANALVSTGRLDEAERFLARARAAGGRARARHRDGAARGSSAAPATPRAAIARAPTARSTGRPSSRAARAAVRPRARPARARPVPAPRRPAALGGDLLTAAAETFSALGARPALERTERELDASGLRPSRDAGRPAHAAGADRRAAGRHRAQQPRGRRPTSSSASRPSRST